MPSANRKSRLKEVIAARGWQRIGEAEWEILTAMFPGLSTSDMRVAAVPVDAPWCGVAQQTFDKLEQSLCELSGVYALRGDLQRFCREQVIQAKDRARLVSRNKRISEEKRALKAEMVAWMLVWLGDPAIFPTWAQARRAHLDRNVLRPPTWMNTG